LPVTVPPGGGASRGIADGSGSCGGLSMIRRPASIACCSPVGAPAPCVCARSCSCCLASLRFLGAGPRGIGAGGPPGGCMPCALNAKGCLGGGGIGCAGCAPRYAPPGSIDSRSVGKPGSGEAVVSTSSGAPLGTCASCSPPLVRRSGIADTNGSKSDAPGSDAALTFRG
jgi:hypothetical protein